MSAWGKTTTLSTSAAPISFKSIIEQQSSVDDELINRTIFGFEATNAVSHVENAATIEYSDDFKLAQLLQQFENEDVSASNEAMLRQENKRNHDQNVFSKISVISRYNSSPSQQKHSYHVSNVQSSGFNEAIHRENQLQTIGVDSSSSNMFKGGVTMLPDGHFVSKHDSLLNSLSNSVKLSEIEGVGDLSGRGILIGNSVANSIRSSAQRRGNR